MEKEKSLSNFSIVAFVLSFIIFPVGLILSIIGLIRCKNYEKETGEKVKYKLFNIIGIVVSIIEFIICLIGFVIAFFVFRLVVSNDSEILGNYACHDKYSTVPTVTAEFNNNKFMWAMYKNEKNNYIIGSYKINKRQITNGEYTYGLKLKPVDYKSTARVTIQDSYDITINKKDGLTTIKFPNGALYRCTKVEN